MSDNRLLTENTIRRFMKLANVDSLTENFLEEGGGYGAMPPGKRVKPKGKHDEDPAKRSYMEESEEEEATIEEDEVDDEEKAI